MIQNRAIAGLAIAAGCAIIAAGDALLDVQIEIFRGIHTFTFPWMLNVFLVPFAAGLAVALIYRQRAGKWLAFLPPVIVRIGSVIHLYFTNDAWNADLFYHLHFHYWGLASLLTMQASYLGGMWGATLSGSYLTDKTSKSSQGNGSSVKQTQRIGDNP